MKDRFILYFDFNANAQLKFTHNEGILKFEKTVLSTCGAALKPSA
jgi:hypothetical protein